MVLSKRINNYLLQVI